MDNFANKYIFNANVELHKNLKVTYNTTILDTTLSQNYSSGALLVNGGVGISQNLNVKNNITGTWAGDIVSAIKGGTGLAPSVANPFDILRVKSDKSGFEFFKQGETHLDALGNIAVGKTTFTGILSQTQSGTGHNIAIGKDALKNNTSGFNNLSIGISSSVSNVSGYNNISLGSFANFSSTTGHHVIGIGDNSGFFNTTAIGNVNIGYRANYHNSTGDKNVCIGYDAGYTSSINNAQGLLHTVNIGTNSQAGNNYAAAIGLNSVVGGEYGISLGANITGVGNYSICIGANSKTEKGTSANANNSIAIGHQATATGNNTIRLGNNLITNASCQVAFANPSDSRIKTNVEDVPDKLALQQVLDLPCRYYNYIDINRGTEKTIGFIAQEVKEKFPMAVTQITEYIPNEYKNAVVEWTTNVEDNTKYNMKVTNLSNISANDYVQFKVTNNSEEYDIILQTLDGTTFTTDMQYDTVFVYGKKIEDFNILNKEKIFTLHHSAIQEMHKEINMYCNINQTVASFSDLYKTNNKFKQGLIVCTDGSIDNVKISTSIRDKKILGTIESVIMTHSNPAQEQYIITKKGKVIVSNINGDIEEGDYITSSEIAGFGMKQNNDKLYNYTLGKCANSINWSNITTVTMHSNTEYKYTIVDFY